MRRGRPLTVFAAVALGFGCDAPPLAPTGDAEPGDVAAALPDAEPDAAADLGPDAADAALPADGGQDPGTVAAQARLFGAQVVVRVDIELDDVAFGLLRAAPRTYVAGNVVIDGVRRDGVGVRLKGSASFKPITSKAAFKIDVARYAPGARLHGLRQFTFNNMVQDHSKVRERLAATGFARMGVPAPRVGYAELFVNGQPYGLYTAIEPVDEVFLERIAPGQGPAVLYEGEFDRDLWLADIDTFDRDAGQDGDRATLRRLIAGLDRALPLTFDLDVGAVVDLPAARRFFAAEMVLGHWDGYAAQRNNYFVWFRPSDGRALFVPWGTDQIYARVRDPFVGRGRLFRMCADWLPCRLPYAEQVRAFAELQAAHDTAAEVEQIRALIDPVLEADPKNPTSPERRADALAELLAYAGEHPARMLAGLRCLDPADDLDGDLTLACAGDCDEDDPGRHPGAAEVCGDEIDQSCSGVTDDGQDCPPCRIVDGPDGARFLLCHGEATYAQPEEICARYGLRLASVRSAEEQAALTALAMQRVRSDWWLGMRFVDDAPVWLDGSPVDYTAWAPDEPHGGGCVVLGRDSGLWRAVHCGLRYPVICRLVGP